MSKSNYSYVIKDGVLCITDHNGPKSVSNNAENVLEEIKAELEANKELTGNTPMPEIIIYCDTNGDWDGITYDGNDADFYFLNTTDLTEAIKEAKNLIRP